MMSLRLCAFTLGMASLEGVFGMFPPTPRPPALELTVSEMETIMDTDVTLVGSGNFTQPINHSDPSFGTFQIQYWYNATNWKGPGSPVVIFTPGEAAAAEYTGYLTERALTGKLAAAIGGAVVLVEHRYWGDSNPYANQTTTNLQYLTLEQAVADFVNFAENASLPFDTTGKTNAAEAPWVWVGGSYSGALSVWIEELSPGTFWAYHSTSGPVEAIYDYWEYFYPIQDGMPNNCSIDFAAIIAHIDDVFVNGTDAEITALKQQFHLEDLEHNDDTASAISSPIWYWQNIQQYSGYSTFYQMCDYIEGFAPGKNGTYKDNGVGLSVALPNYAAWYTSIYLPGSCDSYGYTDWSGENNVQCFDTYNTSMEVFHDLSDSNPFDRTWVWMTCNEPFFYWQTGAPEGRPTVMSRLVNAEYYQRQCGLWFPTEDGNTFGSNEGLTADSTNSRTQGWFATDTTRLLYVNGQYDPWRSASVASEFRPDGPFNGTADVPAVLISGSRHCNDLLVANAQVNAAVAAAQATAVSQISAWVDEFSA